MRNERHQKFTKETGVVVHRRCAEVDLKIADHVDSDEADEDDARHNHDHLQPRIRKASGRFGHDGWADQHPYQSWGTLAGFEHSDTLISH